jgi:pimeloyl-ACP methyl ester carboxylesterase
LYSEVCLGGIATSFASFYPEKVNKLVLIAPTGLMDEKDLPWTGKLARHPLIRPILSLPFVRPLALLGIQHFYKSSRKAQPSTQETSTIARIALYQFEHHPGFIRAFLGTVADFPFYSLHDRYQMVGRLCGDGSSLQVLALWGDADKV